MGGRSVIVIGDLWQLPPIKDKIVLDKNKLDGRPECAPSHFRENLRIFYLTEKMRSQKDPYFSSLCDRVGRGKQTEEDEVYLKSRIKRTENERNNEKFKNGEISIIVTTNDKRELINNQKLDELLPNGKEYLCNCVDRITNLPHGPKLSDKDQDNLGKTGNLPNKLRLKVGAPVMITSNHKKAKYREDGIANAARGYVKAIQVSEDNPDCVEVVWVVFKNENVGKLYRFDHKKLRDKFNPGHPLATPILPERKTFTPKGGSIQYQRTNFPLCLAYALTSWKCQGDTLNEVIIDFGEDKEHGIKNYLCAGSFYVALTRVRTGDKVFLRSFHKSYIVVKHQLEEKIEAMRKFNDYKMKKIYLDEKIFIDKESEWKFGFLNINGLMEGNHGDYLNEDKNLINLDILVLGETKLDSNYKTSSIQDKLDKWDIFGRHDANDGSKHMGLLLLSPKESNIRQKIKSATHKSTKRNQDLQIQGVVIRMINGLAVGFLYCRSTPNNLEINKISKSFEECQFLMGDFNLSPTIISDSKKLDQLCKISDKFLALKETTRVTSNNQLDHILADKSFLGKCFATSYFNFISDHKAIVIRLTEFSNFTNEFLERVSFDSEFHLKKKIVQEDKTYPSEDKTVSKASLEMASKDKTKEIKSRRSVAKADMMAKFNRRFRNPDMASCWLNSCLQLLLSGFDHSNVENYFESELGSSLWDLLNLEPGRCIDPTDIKNIITYAEDMKIAKRKSDVMQEIKDKKVLSKKLQDVDKMYLNLKTGQQCVRDFFICLHENMENWIDVYQMFIFTIINQTSCITCGHKNAFEQSQIYLEIDVPPEGSSLCDYVEQTLNDGIMVEYYCEDGCKTRFQAEKRTLLKSNKEAQFIIVMLQRTILSENVPQIIFNNIDSQGNINIR